MRNVRLAASLGALVTLVIVGFQNCGGFNAGSNLNSISSQAAADPQAAINSAQTVMNNIMVQPPNTAPGLQNAIQTLQQLLQQLENLNTSRWPPDLQQVQQQLITLLMSDIAQLQTDLQSLNSTPTPTPTVTPTSTPTSSPSPTPTPTATPTKSLALAFSEFAIPGVTGCPTGFENLTPEAFPNGQQAWAICGLPYTSSSIQVVVGVAASTPSTGGLSCPTGYNLIKGYVASAPNFELCLQYTTPDQVTDFVTNITAFHSAQPPCASGDTVVWRYNEPGKVGVCVSY